MPAAATPKANIYWLASYPKSGNTWVRAFIANLRQDGDEPVAINDIQTGPISSSKTWLEKGLGFDIDELPPEQLALLRPVSYRHLSAAMEEPGCHKTHDAYIKLPNDEWLMPPDVTRGALYIVRNPLDVSISFAHHLGRSIDDAIETMANPEAAFCKSKRRYLSQTKQRLLTWSEHVDSWLTAPIDKRLLLRYEDLRANPAQQFSCLAAFLELPSEQSRVNRAVAHCELKTLQSMEDEQIFREKPFEAERFFRKGRVGDWQSVLSSKQVDRIISSHAEVMTRLGYLDVNGSPLSTQLPLDESLAGPLSGPATGAATGAAKP